MNRYVALLLVCATLAIGVAPAHGARAADAPAGNSAFLRTWARTDKAVADQRTSRTWMWGPQANTPLLLEPYRESPNGLRVVQYFDKSRMEITQPSGDPATPWYVTNGLLATELITGRMQVGDASFQQRAPAEVNVAGDADDPHGPTYATFSRLPAGAAPGAEAVVTRGLRRDGSVFNDERFAQYAIGTTHFTAETGYWIATPFWEFMNSSGLVYASGFYSTAALFENPYYATGFPISAAYWAASASIAVA
ncbi:MAG: hypothetical protein DCC58_15430 [Chloroflexi bacterium]|nr:MAG: hypothetical protein DCC58_15430 [Chloroflexota bacterium]